MSDARLDCPAAVDFTDAEIARLASVPHAAHDVPRRAWCELEAGHPGRHVSLAQAEDAGTRMDGPEVSYWVWWDGNGAHEIATAPDCEAVNSGEDPDGEFCLLPSGHAGSHLF